VKCKSLTVGIMFQRAECAPNAFGEQCTGDDLPMICG
jgi:hypothetical protein